MGLFGVLLKAVPWGTLLANGPAIARAAEGMLSKSHASRAQAEQTGDALRALGERVSALEANQVELSELVKRMADQGQRLTESADVLAARVRWLIAVAALACGLGVTAIILALR
jgi:hypothetical protein